ncbi:DnaJ domain-containing protein [Thiomicrorhabdus aquaedulcis]|uniref:DnaJ domain-containing protein n=1 Tax=Thiomicrorhabdus aquaedulcis TaxID=2211106 RepID=UPI000FDCB96A|nr:DnaJ domain-containing protein [Thiomicrorhabdus aquaedulcis]
MSSFNALYDPLMDYFAVLGVHQGACQQSVKLAYRKMARRYHPDVSKIVDATTKFQEIAHAYEVLTKHRKTYCQDFELARRQQQAMHAAQTARAARSAQFAKKEHTAHTASKKSCEESGSHHAKNTEFSWHNAGRGQKPLNGKNRLITYPLTLRYAIRLLKLGFFYIPGLKINMKFTREAFEGKTFRIAGKGYSGLFGGTSGDYLVRFNIKLDTLRYELKGADIHGVFYVEYEQLTVGKSLMLDAPSGHFSVLVSTDFASNQVIKVPNMGLPGDARFQAGHLYARLVVR